MLGDDLVPFLGQGDGPGLRFRQGEILFWNPDTGENVIDIAGTHMSNVPILNTGEAIALKAGNIVGVLTWESSWFILGRITPPNDPNFASASVAFATARDQTTNFSIDGTPTVKASASVTAPSWADEALVMLTVTATAVNSFAGNIPGQAVLVPRINGVVGIANTAGLDAANVAFQNFAVLAGTKSAIITDPDVITVDAQLYTNGDTWPANPFNGVAVDAIIVYRSTT